MTTVRICNDPLNLDSYKEFETDSVCELLMQEFGCWSPANKVYKETVDVSNHVPINSSQDVAYLESLEGLVWVVVYPQGLGLIAAGLIGATVAVTALGKDDSGEQSTAAAATSTVQEAEQSEPSPNNSLSERSNSNRLNSRIPDIYGTVISSPDLIMDTLRFNDVEFQYLCVGEGEYELSEFKDGDGNFVGDLEVYGPGTSPNSGDPPQMVIGNPINRPISIVQKVDDFSTSFTLTDVSEVIVSSTGSWREESHSPPFKIFGQFGGGGAGRVRVGYIELDITGVPVVGGVTGSQLISIGTSTASLPKNANWQITLTAENGFLANNGTPELGESGNQTGFYLFDTTQVQEVTITSAVSSAPLETINEFGNVTTIYTRVVASENTSGNRKLTCKATRKIPILQNDLTFGPAAGTSEIKDIIPALLTSPSVGNRPITELNLQNLIDVQNEVQNYFGTSKAIEFNYTFDDENLSLEETLLIVAETAFCDVYRRGSQIELFFEKEVNSSSLLFNHRNKLPNTETRTVSFGYLDDHDGVEVEFQNLFTRLPDRVLIPADGSAVNPEKIVEIGVTNRLQAYFHAHRAWNRIRYQNCVVEFEATQEAALLRRKERVLVSNNTRSGTFDGELLARSENTLTLSQDVEFEDGVEYVIFLQNRTGNVVSKTVTAGPSPNQVIVSDTAGLFFALGRDLFAVTTYEIVAKNDGGKRAFLVTEKEPNESFTSTVRCVNYDERYYQNDLDLIKNIIDENADLI